MVAKHKGIKIKFRKNTVAEPLFRLHFEEQEGVLVKEAIRQPCDL